MKPTFTRPWPYALAVGVILAVSSAAPSAQALQPIEAFLTAARARNSCMINSRIVSDMPGLYNFESSKLSS